MQNMRQFFIISTRPKHSTKYNYLLKRKIKVTYNVNKKIALTASLKFFRKNFK